jgi:hypothetical protein
MEGNRGIKTGDQDSEDKITHSPADELAVAKEICIEVPSSLFLNGDWIAVQKRIIFRILSFALRRGYWSLESEKATYFFFFF